MYKVWLLVSVVFSISVNASASDEILSSFKKSPETFISEKIEEKHTFYGLASYYNKANYYIVDSGNIEKIDNNASIVLDQTQWFVAAGRFNVLAIKQSGLSINIDDSKLVINNPTILNEINMAKKPELSSISPELDQVRYANLWTPLAWLAKIVESSLVLIQAYLVGSWGWSVVVFAIFLKFLLLPIGIMTNSFQRRVSQVQTKLAPKLAEIKKNYDGEEAHNRLMAAHKELGVSPFYTLKPILGSFIQIPILIAVFNALGEMPQFDGQSFLWIENLAYPDSIAHLPFAIPMFGSTVNLLPFLMTIITIYSTIAFRNKHASEAEMKRQKRNLYYMAITFFVLFYPFPAVMVLYWTLANILQYVQQKYVEI